MISSEAYNAVADAEAKWMEADVAAAGSPTATAEQVASAAKLLEAMKDAADRPSKTRMVAVMDAAIAADNLEYAFLAVQEINKRGYQQDPMTLNRLVKACVSAGQVDRGYQLVDSFSNFGVLSDAESLSILIKGYVDNGAPFKAYGVLKAWDNLTDAGTPEADMLKSLQAALTSAGGAEEAAAVAAKM